MPHRTSRWIWAGRLAALLIVAGLVAYLAVAGLDKADKLSSAVAAIAAVLALVAPYVLPMAPSAGRMSVRNATVRGHVRQQGAGEKSVDGLWAGGDLTQADGDPTKR